MSNVSNDHYPDKITCWEALDIRACFFDSAFDFSVCTKCTNAFPAGSRRFQSSFFRSFVHCSMVSRSSSGITEFDGKQYHVGGMMTERLLRIFVSLLARLFHMCGLSTSDYITVLSVQQRLSVWNMPWNTFSTQALWQMRFSDYIGWHNLCWCFVSRGVFSLYVHKNRQIEDLFSPLTSARKRKNVDC